MAVLKKAIQKDCEADRERVLDAIADDWHGDLKAYLLSIARVKDAAVRSARDRDEDYTADTMLKFARR